MQLVHQEVVDHAIGVVVHPLPHLRGNNGDDRPGNEHRGAHRTTAFEIRIHYQGDDHAQNELEHDGDDRELYGDPDGPQKVRIGKEIGVVVFDFRLVLMPSM